MKNGDMILILNNLPKLAEKKLPQKISYAITKNNMLLVKEYEVYAKELEKLNNEYDEYFIKDKDGNTELNDIGLPKIKDNMSKEYYGKVNELLSIDIDVDLYKIDEECFNYDDTVGKYDVLSLSEIMFLQSFLCKDDKDKSDE